MANPAYVGSAANTDGDYQNSTISYTPTAGNCLVVIATIVASSTSDTATCSTTGTVQSLTQLYYQSPGSNLRVGAAWYLFNVSGATGVKISTSAFNRIDAIVIEFSNVSSIDVSPGTPAYASYVTTVTTPTVTTTNASDMLVAAFLSENATMLSSASNSFTLTATQKYTGAAYLPVSSTGSYSTTLTAASQDWLGAWLFALSGSGGGGGGATPHLLALMGCGN